MSAHEQMRQMLDQLMGTGRDGENNRYKVKFSDVRVCKSFLLGCCPHDILASTRMDLGDCPKIHDLALRADYEQAAGEKDYYYDIDAMEHLQAFISDCDRRTELAKRRLAETQEELSAEVAAKANKVHELAEQIGKKLAKAEQLGAEGNVEDSLKHMEEVEDYRKKKGQAEQEYRNSMPASSYQQQKLRVCEVCSAYLGIHDNDRRLADHFGGKLHLGFIKIREKLDDLKKMVNERREKHRPEDVRRMERDSARADRDSSADRSFRNSRMQNRTGGGGNNSRHDRRRDRSRSRDRSQRGSSYRSHDRNYRSRSRDRYSRQRNNYRENKRGDRSRSRDRQHSRSYNNEERERRGERSKSREQRFSDEDNNSRSSKTRDEYRESAVEDLHQKLLDLQQEVVAAVDGNNSGTDDF